MNLLEAFIKYAPDDIYNGLKHLDKHHIASTHTILADAIDERINQQIIHEANRLKKLEGFPSRGDLYKARLQVDEARLALMEEPEVMKDLEAAKQDFCEVVKLYTQTFSRRKPSFDIFKELENEFSKVGTWYRIFPPIYCPLIQLDVRAMGICVTWSFSPGSLPSVDIRKTTLDQEMGMHRTWNESLALAARILEIVGIPHDVKYIANFPESMDLRRCLLHGMLPPYDGSNDDKLNAEYQHPA